MAPQGLVILGQVLAENVGLSANELIWIGSPSWVAAGVISSSILDAARRKIDERRIGDIQRIAELARTHSRPIIEASISGMPTSMLSNLEGLGSSFDLDRALPATARWRGIFFGGREGTFVGVSPSRERKAREALREYARSYVIDPWSPTLTCRLPGREFEISKDRILRISAGDVPFEPR